MKFTFDITIPLTPVSLLESHSQGYMRELRTKEQEYAEASRPIQGSSLESHKIEGSPPSCAV